MFCQHCGQQYDSRAPRCPRCGAPTQVQPVVYAQPVQQQESNGIAIAGFVLSLIGFLACGMTFICQILGFIFSCIGVSRAKKANGEGKGLAVAGIVLGILSWLPAILLFVFVIGVSGTMAAM